MLRYLSHRNQLNKHDLLSMSLRLLHLRHQRQLPHLRFHHQPPNTQYQYQQMHTRSRLLLNSRRYLSPVSRTSRLPLLCNCLNMCLLFQRLHYHQCPNMRRLSKWLFYLYLFISMHSMLTLLLHEKRQSLLLHLFALHLYRPNNPDLPKLSI